MVQLGDRERGEENEESELSLAQLRVGACDCWLGVQRQATGEELAHPIAKSVDAMRIVI